MNRRDFLKISSMGAMALLVNGCGFSGSAAENDSNRADRNVAGGNGKMKIVVITSSPHPKNESTSSYLADRFVSGAQSAGHEVFVFDAAKYSSVSWL